MPPNLFWTSLIWKHTGVKLGHPHAVEYFAGDGVFTSIALVSHGIKRMLGINLLPQPALPGELRVMLTILYLLVSAFD